MKRVRVAIVGGGLADPFTATEADQSPQAQHGAALRATAADGLWQGRLTGIASEWSPQFPGYVAGAIDAAAQGVQTLMGCSPDNHAP